MSVDFPRAWEIARSVPAVEHNPKCSFAQTDGGLLCDCWVVMRHPEHLDEQRFYTRGGQLFTMTTPGMRDER